MKRSTFKLGIRFLIFCIIGSLLFGDAITDKVDSLFAPWNKPDSPGCALGIIKDGKLIYKRGYGMANLEYGIPITSQSVFRIGSTSKQFSAMCMVLLEEEGKLSLDDDIRKYIPELPEYETPITIRHLLHHTSGIRDYLTLMTLAGEREDDFFTNEEVVGFLARQMELNFKPGEEHLYSNSGYFLLSVITKRITGESMSIYAEKNIFEPLGMENTHFHDNHTSIVRNRASGYLPREEGGFQISMTTLDMIGDGGIFTCVDDLLLWNQNFYNNRLGEGRQELINKMITP
jgi:CubicO group peptidase (beta-lactamase class C family)